MNEKFQRDNVNSEGSEANDAVPYKLHERSGGHFKKIHNICIIVPIHNESENIKITIPDILQTISEAGYNTRILLVDDGSTDDSLDITRQLSSINERIDYISFSRNFGKEAAIIAGLHECQNGYDAIAYMDGDGQHTAEDLLMLVRHTENTGCDITCGARSDRNYQGPLQRFLSEAFYNLFHLLTNQKIEKGVGDFNVLRPQVVQALCSLKERNPFMKGIISWIGFRKEIVDIHVKDRIKGYSKSSIMRMMKLALSALISFSAWPLKLWSFIGVFSALISFLYLTYVVFEKIHYGIDIPGYATIIVLILGIGGTQLLSIGIIGEYIARIYDASQQRPRYLIAERSAHNTSRSLQ